MRTRNKKQEEYHSPRYHAYDYVAEGTWGGTIPDPTENLEWTIYRMARNHGVRPGYIHHYDTIPESTRMAADVMGAF